jgi:hypothetical protein
MVFFQEKIIHKIKTHILYSIFFLENRAVYEIMWKKYCTAGQAIDDMNAHCRLDSKGTNTHSEYALNIAFPQQQLLHERASITLYVHFLSRSS